MPRRHSVSARLIRLIPAAVITAAVVCTGVVRAQSGPVPPTPHVTYLTPIWGGIIGASDAEVAAQVATLRTRIGEGGGLKVGFAAYLFVNMADWNVDLSSPAAIRAALGDFEGQLDAGIRHARANNIPFVVTMLTALRAKVDPAQRTSCDEDRRVMQWLGDNQAKDGWWTFSRYARRQYRVQQAYMKEVAKILASRIAQDPETLVAIAGDGEIELDSEDLPKVADYSPFAIAEFRDWLRGEGLYAPGAPFDGEAWASAARYRHDASPAVDTNGDGHTLNGDFGTSFTSWNLRYFDWSLSDPDTPDPKAIPKSVYADAAFDPMPDAGAQYFDASRIVNASDPWWNIWDQFRQTMIWRHNKDLARWMTTTPDDMGRVVPADRWFSYQIPADYLFGGTPENPNSRLLGSASPWWTANVMPYGGLGFTSFGVRFGTNTYLRTLPGYSAAIKSCEPGITSPPTCVEGRGGLAGTSWGIFEWNPVVPLASADSAERALRQSEQRRWAARAAPATLVSSDSPGSPGSPGSGSPGTGPQPFDTAIYQDEIEILRRYRPRVLAPFMWESSAYRILDTGFETALRRFAEYLRDGWAPTLKVDRTSVAFTVQQVQGVTANFTSTQIVRVSQPTGGTVDWSVSADKPWIVLSPESGHGDGTFTISVDPGRMALMSPGTYTAVVTVSGPGSVEGVRTINVPVVLTNDMASAPPFGSFDTPLDGATGLQGSLAVTGWALDDIEIDRVELWRDPVPNETTPPYITDPAHPAYGKIFIANPFFVSGARTDVEAAFPESPFANRAGWGYLLLSWGLWNQGNDRYTLYAYAFDKEGHHSLLGTRTITVDNAHATRPFGAIDTPGYGATVAGAFWNFGWALTPPAEPECAISNGDVKMNIDSGPLLAVNYGDLRTDIAAAFPGFSNDTGSSGAYYLDTSTIGNGIHQIGWLVTDTCGRQDGVGSRFFNVLNGGARPADDAGAEATSPGSARAVGAPLMAPAREPATAAGRDESRPYAGTQTPDAVHWAAPAAAARPAVRTDPVHVRRLRGEWQAVALNADGTRVIEVDQDQRIEVQLPALLHGTYAGFQQLGPGRRPLPLGSSLDARAGIFYWQPSPGFLGIFDLLFAPVDGADGFVRVRVVVGPPMRMVVDTPAQAAVVSSPFTVSGWAVDLASDHGAGVDTVHVWAYPADGGAPLWLGVAACGGSRPDVGALYGPTFVDASFSLVVDQLPAGTYDVVAYAHRARTTAFEAALSVRITVRQ
ncbi:MAG: hypothetical protein NTV05_16665 [Acidobacteria bacterium]|nr:hypothetical protein [Acidobacteriota bacterium]